MNLPAIDMLLGRSPIARDPNGPDYCFFCFKEQSPDPFDREAHYSDCDWILAQEELRRVND